MIRVHVISKSHEQDLANEINYMLSKKSDDEIISIEYVYNSYKEVYTAFILYKEV